MSGLHHTIAALARMGHNVVVDHALTDARYVADIVTVWQSFPVWLVGVFCPLETIHQRVAARQQLGGEVARTRMPDPAYA